jgi:flagellar protein FlaI
MESALDPTRASARSSVAIVDTPDRSTYPYRREVTPPFAHVEVTFDPGSASLRYEVHEPALTEEEREASDALDRALPRILAPLSGPATPERRTAHLSHTANEFLAARYPGLSSASRERILYFRRRDAIGYGPIDAILRDPEIEDVSCDGVGSAVFVYHARFESIRTNVVFPDEGALNGYVVRLAQRCARSVSGARPLLDASTPEGHRVQLTYGRSVSGRGSTFTLRRFRDRPFTPIDLVRNGSWSAEMVAYLWLAAEHRDSMIVAGGPGAGKTSTLNAIALFVAASAKIVSIEDTREINLPHANWVPLTTRTGASMAGIGTDRAQDIDLFDLLTAALRQRPSHIVVGEVRGREAYTMFQAMNTGHATYATMHADSLRALVQRLESPPIQVPRALLSALREVLIETLTRTPSGPARRVRELVEVRGVDADTGEVVSTPVFTWDEAADTFHYLGHSYLFERIATSTGRPTGAVDEEFRRRAEAIQALADTGRPIGPADMWQWIRENGRWASGPAEVP